MQKVEEIYQGTVLPLAPEERLQLASLILSGLTGQEKQEKLSAVALIGSFPRGRGFGSAEDVDAYLREERDSWER
jgi:hypothetical protein